MSQLFHLLYEVRPLPENANWTDAGGAFANCYVLAQTGEEASRKAVANFADHFWELVAQENGPQPVSRDEFLDDPETLDCVDEALTEGECYVYHLWPNEPQEGDTIH
jgi:hypothetical protein